MSKVSEQYPYFAIRDTGGDLKAYFKTPYTVNEAADSFFFLVKRSKGVHPAINSTFTLEAH